MIKITANFSSKLVRAATEPELCCTLLSTVMSARVILSECALIRLIPARLSICACVHDVDIVVVVVVVVVMARLRYLFALMKAQEQSWRERMLEC